MHYALLNLPWWGYVLATLLLTHVTIASVTIFLHRHQAHRALELHPIASHFFRFWLWLTTGTITREWTAIHRKHHAKCETTEDPHSPQIVGIRKVLLEGYELYRKEAANLETLETYGRGTPDDWLERNLFSRHALLGIMLMLAADLVLFGPIGLTIWAVQMAWIPVMAAGIINGAGHYWGYRNFQLADASTNIVPWGILIGGEELHNNHHTYMGSAKLSNKWYEIDIGWFYIRIMAALRLCKIKKVAPKVQLDASKTSCDIDTLRAVLANRYAVMADFAKLLKQTYREESAQLKAHLSDFGAADFKRIRKWLRADESVLSEQEKMKLGIVILTSPKLDAAYSLRKDLVAVWQRSTASMEQMVQDLEDWCHRAEASGIQALQQFSRRLRSYA